jgi:superfamily II DNA or RNA helicase
MTSTDAPIMPKTLTTYLGQKGYTILKNELNVEQQYFIRKELTIKPHVSGPCAKDASQPSYPVYRESAGKIYVPRYFGQLHFGKPGANKISEGDDISMHFTGTLRPNQVPAVQSYLDCVLNGGGGGGGGLLDLPCAFGKTSLSLYIASKLAKKTLVIVHKEFLMNQWIERITQFIPGAKVGRIQGQIIDIEGKDIVLGMLQSLSMKEYPAQMFDCFGLTIIDEVHHISSEVFSRALFKLVTKYTLGLSATMNRKDGTTKVFKMFLGDVIYKATREQENAVEVRAITYKTGDEDFNDTVYDFRGQPQIPTMISKLCAYSGRTEFIIKVLNDYICVDNVDKAVVSEHKAAMDRANPCCKLCNKNDNYLMKNTCCGAIQYCLPCLNRVVEEAKYNLEQSVNKKTGVTKSTKKRPKCPACAKVLAYEQNYVENPYVKPLERTHTIIMSHNLNVLEYIYNRFVCKNFASVGYYVGGMSEQELKRSEKQQVVLSSYQLASEGLDIPSLNTEFLITPKTDIVQIVGRILRAKHAYSHPIIYDFVDTHEVFQRQWCKRKAYYKKQQYKIVGTDSVAYPPTRWRPMFEPFLNGNTSKKEDELLEEDLLEDDDDDDDLDNDDSCEAGAQSVTTKSKPVSIFGGKCLLKIKR